MKNDLPTKHILILVDHLQRGGAQKTAAALSIALSHHHTVTLATFSDFDQPDFEYAGELVRISLPYSGKPRNHIFKRIQRFLSLVKQIRSLKRGRNITVAISFMEVANISNIFSSVGERTILSVRSHLSEEFQDNKRLRVFRQLIRMCYPKAHAIIVPSKGIAVDLIRNFNIPVKKITTIPNFIDRQSIAAKRTELIEPGITSLLNSYPVISNMGRITTAKGQELLVKALAGVHAHIPSAKLLILGDGPEKQKLISTARTLGLTILDLTSEMVVPPDISDYDILLLGFRQNPFPYLSATKAFVMSSVYEGFPNAVIESMQCGVPVISTDCPSGPREILSPQSNRLPQAGEIEFGEYGILISPPFPDKNNTHSGNALLLSEAITSILTHEAERTYYARQSIKRAAQFDKSTIIPLWLNSLDG